MPAEWMGRRTPFAKKPRISAALRRRRRRYGSTLATVSASQHLPHSTLELAAVASFPGELGILPAAAGMPAGEAPEGTRQAAPESGGDRIGALPDELLRRVLSFLPAQQAVQTCVLARRWLHLWRSAPVLRIVGADGEAPVPFVEVREFVDSLLLLRGSSPLETFELSFAAADDIDARHLRPWIRYAVQCKVHVLRLSFHGNSPAQMRLVDLPLASKHLTKLGLRGLAFNDDVLDFSRCPQLQDLQIQDCSFELAERISSQSLRHLSITTGRFNQSSRARILAPNLASFVLDVTAGRTPVLQNMPLLVKGNVVIAGVCKGYCHLGSYYGDCGNENCRGCIRDDSSSVVLHGMSQAKSLLLVAYPEKFIFRRDLKLCPTFNQLKTLGLNENWCVPDEHPLACILEHSPVLEKLCLVLYFKSKEVNVEMKGRFNPKELPPTISSHLKGVEITCGGVDGKVLKVLKFMRKLNISFSFVELEA